MKVLPVTPVPLNVPPVGVAFKVTAPAEEQSGEETDANCGVGVVVTEIEIVLDPVHPLPSVTVYVTTLLPVAGLKVDPVTPVPENVPPVGLATRVTALSVEQSAATVAIVGVGPAVIVKVVVLIEPGQDPDAAMVLVTVYVPGCDKLGRTVPEPETTRLGESTVNVPGVPPDTKVGLMVDVLPAQTEFGE